MVKRLLMVRWVVGSIPHNGLIELFLISSTSPTGGTCYPVCGMVHIKNPLLLIEKSIQCIIIIIIIIIIIDCFGFLFMLLTQAKYCITTLPSR